MELPVIITPINKDRTDQVFESTTKDISSGGAFIKTTQPLAMDTSKQVTAEFFNSGPPIITGELGRLDQHNVVELEGETLEKYETDASLPGLYLYLTLERLGDFLEIRSDGTFYLEETGVGSTGRWEKSDTDIVLTFSQGTP